jgi:large subunit ribosomal protein L35
MPKMKSKRSAAKRFTFTGTGKVRRRKAYRSHILTKKSAKRKRNLRKSTIMEPQDAAHVKQMLPYGG